MRENAKSIAARYTDSNALKYGTIAALIALLMMGAVAWFGPERSVSGLRHVDLQAAFGGSGRN